MGPADMRTTDGKLWGRLPAHLEGRYLLSGYLRLRLLWSLAHRPHDEQAPTVVLHVASYHERGRTIYANNLRLPVHLADDAGLSRLADVVLDPAIVRGAIGPNG